MAIFIEGPNGVGKTTLARALTTPLGAAVSAVRVLEPDGQYWAGLGQALWATVVDRWALTDMAEAPLAGRNLALSVVERWHLGLAAALTASTLLLLGEERRYERALERAPELEPAFIMRLPAKPDPEWVKRDLSGLLFARHDKAVRTLVGYQKLGGAGWGSLSPRVLLVAERVNPKRVAQFSFPFQGRRPVGSGPYLYDLLARAGLTPKDVHLVNAYGRHGEPLTEELVRYLRPISVVALGKVALARLRELGFQPASFPHPQVLRRFHFHERAPWVARLNEAVEEGRLWWAS